ncbi:MULTISPECIES: S8 family serine peptidase [unclassified Arsukibacterium]|uniref:S8 family serine peptidase n=1 Tax=unclassified Arsukibacterium TaxID=2635278 RepID=UPI0025C5DA93|nr:MULTISPECIES: S8 family serine peptidase [unclassified Arsukibacterium]|tara:strand:- start:62701 stop:64950 length:2250 start_codon:yes stop_codon:yes gene_type:complete
MLKTNQYRISGLAVAVALSVTACGGSKNIAPEAFNVVVSSAQSWKQVEGSFTVSDVNPGDTLRISTIRENGSIVTPRQGVYTLANGVLTIQGTTFSFLPLQDQATDIHYTVTDGSLSASANLKIAAPTSDPLAYQQWHLNNTGQKAFSLNLETIKAFLIAEANFSEAQADSWINARVDPTILAPGEDMNVVGAFQQNVTGAGSIAVVVDSGLELAHEDLSANIMPNRSLNMATGALNVTDPTSTNALGDHGTSVAGLIAAEGWNGMGGRGVAPDAKLIGMNYLNAQTDLNAALSHGIPGSGITESEPLTVFNRSYGISYPAIISYDFFEEAVQEFSATQLRSGLGAVNTKSSGNSFRRPGNNSWTGSICSAANQLGLTCLNGNFEPSQNTPFYFSVAAVNSNGKHTSYSTAGANVLVSAPAGEYGDFAPAMVTTDQMTCLRGYSSFPSVDAGGWPEFDAAFTPFNSPGHPENASCNYTSTFNGTSSAAPNAAGVIALIHSANPNLSYREIKDILVKTSTQVDPDNEAVVLTVGEGEFIAHPGWVENAAGYSHNNLYGFGRVNAGAAVALAKTYHSELPAQIFSDWVAVGSQAGEAALTLAVADNDATGAVQTIEVLEDITIEGVQFAFDVANAELRSDSFPSQTTAGIDLAIEVTSPNGTSSVLLSSKQAIADPSLDFASGYNEGYILKNSVFLSNAFYGEPAKGLWTIRVIDTNAADYAVTNSVWPEGYKNNVQSSVLEGVAIRVFGH